MKELYMIILGALIGGILLWLFAISGYETGQEALITNFCQANKSITLKQQAECERRLQEYK